MKPKATGLSFVYRLNAVKQIKLDIEKLEDEEYAFMIIMSEPLPVNGSDSFIRMNNKIKIKYSDCRKDFQISKYLE